MKFNFIKKRGFTILEVTIALGIAAVGLLGVVSLVIQNIQAGDTSKNNLTASMLAQEGLELVRNVRDTNWLEGASGNEWKYGGIPGTQNIVQNGTYTIDRDGTIDGSINSFNDAGTKLYLDTNGFYTHSVSATSTLFSRMISITDYSDDEIAASSTVRWVEHGQTHEYVAETSFYNWR